MIRRIPTRLPSPFLMALVLCSALGSLPANATGIPALERPAIQTAKARNTVLLDIARAGERLVAVGERGIVLLSDDAGATWRQAQVPVSVSLTAVQFVDAERGWAVGHMGVVLHSRDGGEIWSKQLDGVRAAQLALDDARQHVHAPDGEKRVKDAEWLVKDGPDKPFLALYFKNRDEGYVVGAYNLIFRTRDGGASWQPWLRHLDNPESLNLYAIRAAGGRLYIAGERGLLLRAEADGDRFEALESPYDGSYFGLLGMPSGELVAYGLRGHAYWSGDRGDTWSPIETGLETTFSSATPLHDGELLLASQAGELLLSQDRGRTFQPAGAGGASVAGIVQAPDGSLVSVGLGGVARPSTAQR